MPLVALGVTALLTGLDWGAWDWASNTGHSTVGLVAGVLMVPAAVAFAGCLVLTAVAIAGRAAARTTGRRRMQGPPAQGPPTSGMQRNDVTGTSSAAAPSGRIAA
jgi:hypothetical protein